MKAEELIELYINGDLSIDSTVISEDQLNEQLLKLIWNKLPSSVKSKLDLKKLSDFIKALDIGETLEVAARLAHIPLPYATSLMTAIEKTGLL